MENRKGDPLGFAHTFNFLPAAKGSRAGLARGEPGRLGLEAGPEEGWGLGQDSQKVGTRGWTAHWAKSAGLVGEPARRAELEADRVEGWEG